MGAYVIAVVVAMTLLSIATLAVALAYLMTYGKKEIRTARENIAAEDLFAIKEAAR